MKATIYIPEDKTELYKRAKSELGGTISAAFVRCMERELEIKHATMNRIVVEISDKNTGRLSKKAFEGRWIVGSANKTETFLFEEIGGIKGAGSYAVAVTKQNRIVVVSENDNDELDGFMVHGDLDDFSSSFIDGQYPLYPESLIAAVKDELGIVHIEEMDI
jgi:hypothetical protein